jgi:hypothetical protein
MQQAQVTRGQYPSAGSAWQLCQSSMLWWQMCCMYTKQPIRAKTLGSLELHFITKKVQTPSNNTGCHRNCTAAGAGAGDSSDAVTSNDALPAPPKFQTALPWEFMGRKPGVDPWPFKDVTRDKTPHLLMAVKLAHYFTFVAQGGVSWMLYQAAPWLTASFAAGVSGGPQLLHWWGSATATPLTQLGAFLLVLGSVYQAMSGAFFIMAVSCVWLSTSRSGCLTLIESPYSKIKLICQNVSMSCVGSHGRELLQTCVHTMQQNDSAAVNIQRWLQPKSLLCNAAKQAVCRRK